MKMPITQIHIADIHFGAIDPEDQYNILEEQFLKPISKVGFQILSIDGDLFDRKFMASSKAVYYANRFVYACANLCSMRGATFIMISGTESHESGQLSLYKDIGNLLPIDIEIIEKPTFIYKYGMTILCLPEEYGKSKQYYDNILKSRVYDMCFMHGTLAGGVYGCNKEDLDNRRPVFDIESFEYCRGPIISGHVHKPMCLKEYMYYVGTPIRYKFGEEEPKGYAILISNENGHYYRFMPIESYRYDTKEISVNSDDPNEIIKYIDSLCYQGHDHLRVQLSTENDIVGKAVTQYYSSNPNIRIDYKKKNVDSQPAINTTQEILEKYKGMDYLLDPSISNFDKLSRYINTSVGYSFITSEELKNIYNGK